MPHITARLVASFARAVVVVAALLPALAGGCSFDVSLDGRACDDEGRCVEGYTCWEGACLRPENVPSPSPDAGHDDDSGPGVVDAGIDAGNDDAGTDDGGPFDASADDDDAGAPPVDAGDLDAGPIDGADADAGNDGDAGSDDGGPVLPWQVVTCSGAPTADTGGATCVAEGTGSKLLLVGDVLLPGKVYEQGGVLLDDNGVIECVGCGCAPAAGEAVQVICPDAVISPGLINAHDHITFTHIPPALSAGVDERFEHRHDWRLGERQHTDLGISGNASVDQQRWGELRFVLAGATSINGSGTVAGLLRNLDRPAGTVTGLSEPTVDYVTFPLGDSSGPLIAAGCAYPNITSPSSADAYTPHVAEGIDAEARNEFLCLTSDASGGSDVLDGRSAVIQGIPLLPIDVQLMAARGMKLIWSPRSNLALYGDTAQVTMFDTMGVEIALGTDWLPTGSMNMLRELRCAVELNEKHLGGYFSDEKLWRMATLGAARAMAMDDSIGVLVGGRIGDISVFANNGRRHYRSVLEAEPADVALVLLAGKPLSGDAALVAALESDCDLVEICQVDKRVCLQRETGMTLAALTTNAGAIYPLFACGVPDQEPMCVPKRVLPADTTALGSTAYTATLTTEDDDGDGILDGEDNCPNVFNPVRPVDNGAQGDADGDAFGDACDPCPLEPDSANCAPPDPDDLDGDGIPALEDNCPAAVNPSQLDADSDLKGDACDACPSYANPGPAACLASVYEIKAGDLAGQKVALRDMVVTAVADNGFFAQLSPTSEDYLVVAGSGIFVFTGTGAPRPARNDRLTISVATVDSYFGQIQLTGPTWTVTGSGPAIVPTVLTQADVDAMVNTGAGFDLEAMLVSTSGLVVTDATPTATVGDTVNEFEVTGGLRVDDVFYLANPLPALGEGFTVLQGIVTWRFEKVKLLPRDAADIAVAP